MSNPSWSQGRYWCSVQGLNDKRIPFPLPRRPWQSRQQPVLVACACVPTRWPAYLCLHHGWALCAQGLYSLKHVHHALITHPLQDDAQSDEHPGAAHTSTAQGQHWVKGPVHQARRTPHPCLAPQGLAPPAVHCDRSILPELFLGLVHLPDEVNEALPCLGYSLLRPICELELPDCPRLPILGEVGREWA